MQQVDARLYFPKFSIFCLGVGCCATGRREDRRGPAPQGRGGR